jgi:hypothetical protein
MTNRTRCLLPLVPALLVLGSSACATRVATGSPLGVAPADHRPRVIRCSHVTFHVQVQPGSVPRTFRGTVTGDLRGTALFIVDSTSIRVARRAVAGSGVALWSITSGTVGRVEFTTTFADRSTAADRSSPRALLSENVGKHTGRSGVAEARLQYRSTFSDAVMQGSHRYRGVLCLPRTAEAD